MTSPRTETVTLQRADSGPDLWTAVEAAQYARLIEHDPPDSAAEAEGMAALIGLFAECSEAWERQTASDQALALERFGSGIEALRKQGLFVHWGVTGRCVQDDQGDSVELPVAVLTITRRADPAIAAEVPAALEAE